jgi:hypothetical protein
MSTLIAKNLQVGTSGTPADNFTIFQPATPDGTLRIGNGNTGITTGLVTLTSAGNLGLGTAPSAWNSLYRAVQLPFGASLTGRTDTPETLLASNTYRDSGGFKYFGTGLATSYFQTAGSHIWQTAASGTAGNAISFTQAMTLTAGGDLAIGTTSSNGRLTVVSPTQTIVRVKGGAGTNQGSAYYIENAGNTSTLLAIGDTAAIFGGVSPDTSATIFTGGGVPLVFAAAAAERARIDSSGRFLVGTTAAQLDSGSKLIVLNSSGTVAEFTNSSGTATQAVLRSWNSATSGDNLFQTFHTDAGATERGSITYNRGAGLVAYNTTSDYRAKDIIGPVVNSGALIDSVPVYMGKMKGATQERPMFIAHETPAYAHTGEKDAVDEDGNPVYQQMDASALIPVMWAEIQSLRARVASLESN